MLGLCTKSALTNSKNNYLSHESVYYAIKS
jgi:hypothetical protein